MTYFKNIKSIEQLKREYKTLVKKYHPDLNRDTDTTEIMKEINAEYEQLFERYKNVHETAGGETYEKKESTTEKSGDYMNIINAIINFNIDIEIIGDWVWCFNSYEYREQLKALGFKYSGKRKAWCWHTGEYKRRKSNMTLDEIKDKYGCDTVKTKKEAKKITA